MIDPKKYGAVLLRNEFPERLEYVRDIEAFDGPLLAEFKGESGEPYLYYWCDRDQKARIDRWLILRSVAAVIARYLTAQITMRDLVQNAAGNVCYIADLNGGEQPINLWYSKTADLHPSYVPSAKSVRAATEVPDGNLQDVFIGEESAADRLVDYRRKYKQATTINALFGAGRAIAGAAITRTLTNCGYEFWRQYKELEKQVPNELRAHDAGWATASAGYVRFDVDPTVAASIRHAVSSFLRSGDNISVLLSDLRRWANAEIARHDDRPRKRPPAAPTINAEQAFGIYARLCSAMQLDSERLLSSSEGALPTASKALLSYANRIAFFADSAKTHDALMVGVAVVAQTTSSRRHHDPDED